MPRKKEYKDQVSKVDYMGYMLLQFMYSIHDTIRLEDSEAQEKFSDFVYYLAERYEPKIEDGYDIEKEEMNIVYKLSKRHK